jgi:hypothetical protein
MPADIRLSSQVREIGLGALYREAFPGGGRKPLSLITPLSPYRLMIVPVVRYVQELSRNPERRIVVVIPEIVEGRWYEYFLHNLHGRPRHALLEVLRQRCQSLSVLVPLAKFVEEINGRDLVGPGGYWVFSFLRVSAKNASISIAARRIFARDSRGCRRTCSYWKSRKDPFRRFRRRDRSHEFRQFGKVGYPVIDLCQCGLPQQAPLAVLRDELLVRDLIFAHPHTSALDPALFLNSSAPLRSVLPF